MCYRVVDWPSLLTFMHFNRLHKALEHRFWPRLDLLNCNMILTPVRNSIAVMPTYRRMCNFSILKYFITLFSLYKNDILAFSTLMSMEKTEHLEWNYVCTVTAKQ